MKRIMLIVLFFLFTTFSFSEENIDFKRFSKGKNYYEQGRYSDARLEFETLIRNFPASLVFKNNYANYYIGMNYYELRNYKKARYYLERAIYLPKEFRYKNGYFKSNKNHFFEYERNYYLAKTLLEFGNREEGINTYKLLVKDYYDRNLTPYEKNALIELSVFNPYYDIIYKVKYQNNLSILPSLKDEDLLDIGNYFMSKGLYDNAMVTLEEYDKKNPNHTSKIKILEALSRSKRYDDVLRLTAKYLKEDKNHDFYYYRGNAYRRKGMVDNAIAEFKKVKEGNFKNTVTYDTARLYFLRRNYSSAASLLKTLSTSKAHKLLIDSYFKSEDYKMFTDSAIEYIKKYPNSDEAAYYRFLLYKKNKNKDYLRWIQKYNLNSYYYEVSRDILNESRTLKDYPINNKLSEYRDLFVKLEDLSSLNDAEILKMSFENLSLVDSDKAFEGLLITMIYEEGGFFHEAIKNSERYKVELSKYENLIEFLYPRYYSKLVKQASHKHGVEEALIYAVMKQESLFNENIISRSAAYGLMQILLPTAKEMNTDVTPEDLMLPSVNIDLGTQYLKVLMEMFDGDIEKVIAAYNGGMGNVTRWTKNNTKKLDIEKIPYPETKEYTKKVINNYYKYKRLYD